MYESSKEFEIQPDSTTDYGVAALERLKKSPWTYNGKNGVANFSQLFLNRSFSYLQVTMTYVHMSLDEFEIRPDTDQGPQS